MPSAVKVTYNLHKYGYSGREIQKQAALPERTLYTHFATAIMCGYPVNCFKLGVNLEDVEKVEQHIKTNLGSKVPRVKDLYEFPGMDLSESTCRLALALIKLVYGLTECAVVLNENIDAYFEDSQESIGQGSSKRGNENSPFSGRFSARKR